jgi:hypothetical protein
MEEREETALQLRELGIWLFSNFWRHGVSLQDTDQNVITFPLPR